MKSDEHQKHSDETQPWNQTFTEVRDEHGNLSRVELRKKSQGHNLITIVLVTLILAIAIAGLTYGLVKQKALGQMQSRNEASVKVVNQVNSKKKSSSAKPTVKKVKKTKAHKQQKKEVPQSSSVQSYTASGSSSQPKTNTSNSEQTSTTSVKTTSSSSPSQSSSSGNGQYAVVGQGQGIYRVAVNNGISEQKLRQLNGLSSTSHLYPGQKLKIK